MLALLAACTSSDPESPAPSTPEPAPTSATATTPTGTTPTATTPTATSTGCDVDFEPLLPFDPDGQPLCDIPADFVASGGDPANPPCAIGAGGVSDRDPADVPASLAVATWNVEFGADQATVVAELGSSLADVDLLLLTEVARHDLTSDPPGIDQVEELGRAAGMTWAYAVEWDRREVPEEGGEHGVAILSRYPLGNAVQFRLAPLNDWWDEDRVYGGRVALGVDVLVGCTPIRAYVLHLDTRGLGDRGRAEQAAVVLADADASPTALQLAGGDLNTWTCNPLVQECNQAPAAERVVLDFFDAGWADAVPDDAGWTQLGEGIFPQKLDWIFHRGGLVPVDGRVLRGVDGSDHVPVVFRFTLPGPP